MIIYFLIFMLGASFGSFIEALVYRREEGISIVSPPSFCNYCGKRILKIDLIPVFSYIFLRGKTRCCGKKIGLISFLVEILAGLSFVLTFSRYEPLEAGFLAFALIMAILISITDYKYMEIYDRDLKLLLILGFVYRLVFIGLDLHFLSKSLIFSLGFLLIRRISQGGLGDGDLFFYLGIFCFLDNSLIYPFVLISIWIGAFFAIIKAFGQRSFKGSIAFCPAIALAFTVILFFKDYI